MMIPDRDKWSMIDLLELTFHFPAVSFDCISCGYQFVNWFPGVKYVDYLSFLERHQIRTIDPWLMFLELMFYFPAVCFVCLSFWRYQFVNWSPGCEYPGCHSFMWRYQRRTYHPILVFQCGSQLWGNYCSFCFLWFLHLRLVFWYRWFVGSLLVVSYHIEAIFEW